MSNLKENHSEPPIEMLEDEFFRLGMWWRILYGILRLIFGISLLFFIDTPVVEILDKIMAHELTQDPNDVLLNAVRSFFSLHGYVITYFLAGYFIFWGLTDVVLSINILRNKLWAFPVTIVLIIGFVFYEIFRFTHTHSLVLLVVMFFDVFVAWLVWRHYKKIKHPEK
jgi:uncharacterized membrane protein